MASALARHLLLCLVGGCATVAPPPVAPPPERTTPEPSAQAANEAKAQSAATEKEPAAHKPPAPVAAAKPSVAVPAAPTAAARPTAPSAATVQKPAAPPLDLDALKQQLKDTNAIGVITKLSLKNQVDDLLQEFRDYYDGKTKVTLAQLRRSYDALLMKVLSLVQDKDIKLATSIIASREPIWGLLSDPKKFAALPV